MVIADGIAWSRKQATSLSNRASGYQAMEPLGNYSCLISENFTIKSRHHFKKVFSLRIQIHLNQKHT